MTSRHKAKGDGYERELAAYINERTGLTTAARAPLSGGGVVGQLSGGADLLGVPNFFIEAKRVERLNFLDALRQVERNLDTRTTDDVALVVNRRNRMSTGQSLCLMRLDDLLDLYGYYLRAEGFVKGDEHEPAQAKNSADE